MAVFSVSDSTAVSSNQVTLRGSDRYWVGGAGNWSDATNHWALSSGGAPAAANLPKITDNVIFDTLSNAIAYTISIDSSAVCRDFTVGAPLAGQVTISFDADITISGSVNMSGGTAGIILTGIQPIIMAPIAGAVVTFASHGLSWPLAQITFQGNSTSTVQLSDDLSTDASLLLTSGSFDATTNLTTVTLLFGNGFQVVQGAFTFYNLTVTGTDTSSSVTFTANITVTNTLSLNGVSDGVRLLVSSQTIGTPRTITSNSNSFSYVDFEDITAAGAANWNLAAITGLSGDCGGNTGITFTTPVDQHWQNANGGAWTLNTNWTSRVPLPQDNVFMDKAFGTSKTVTAATTRLGASIDWTGATFTTSLTFTVNDSYFIFGSHTFLTGMTMSGGVSATYAGRGSYFLTTNGVTHSGSITVDAFGGSLTLGSNLTTAAITQSVNVNHGTFSAVNGASNYIVTAGGITATLSSSVITLGSATHILQNVGSSVWSIVAGATLNAGTSTLKFVNTTNSAITFAGGGKVYNNVWFARGASTGSLTISGSNTFNDLKDDGTAAHSILFTTGTAQTIATFSISGNNSASGAKITINSTTTGTHSLIKSGGGVINTDYLNIQHSVATPAGTWFTGANSTNNQGTATAGSGWVFQTTGIGNPTPSDSSAVSDTPAFFLPPVSLLVSITDSTTTSDTPTITVLINASANESTALSDVPTIEIISLVNATDTTTVTDTPTLQFISTASISVTDSSAVTDTPILNIQILFLVSDSTAVSDTVAVTVPDTIILPVTQLVAQLVIY